MSKNTVANEMKRGMRHLASGVAVVATTDTDGQPNAMTVSSITSVTDTPPSLLVCIHKDAQTHDVLHRVDQFSVNILGHSQQNVSKICAEKCEMSERFKVGEWAANSESNIPYLQDALSVFFCRVSKRLEYGTHMILIGDIESVNVASDEEQPLIYLRGGYVS